MRLGGQLVKVEGVPYGATKRDLYTLFSSVAQINWIHLDQRKKYALLSLYDKSSTDFVLQKEWICFESAMRLSRVKEKRIQRTGRNAQYKKSGEAPHLPCSSIRSPILSPLEEYRKGKSKFWVDVPHEKAIPVKSVFRYKRKKSTYISANSTAGKQHKCKRKSPAKKKKKKSKIPNLDLEMTYENFLEELKPFLKDSRERQSVHQEIKPKHDSSKLKYKRPTAPPKKKIQLIFKGRSLFTVEVDDKMNISLNDIKAVVQEKERIPINIQLLLYEGHILREDHVEQLKNGDCIHVLCRGMGGMQCGSSDGQGKENSTCQLHITSESSEDEVQKWLLEVIRIPSEFRDKFRFLDGKSIDECEDYTDLSSTLLIPIGLARKIFYMKSHDVWFTNIDTSTISSWSADDLSEHLKNVSYEHLRDILREKSIDGLTFLTYSFSSKEELKRDLGLQGSLPLRLLSESRKLKESLTMSKMDIPPNTAASECMPNESDEKSLQESTDRVKQSDQPVLTDNQNQHAIIPLVYEGKLYASVDRAEATTKLKEDDESSLEVLSADMNLFLRDKLYLCRIKSMAKGLRTLTMVSIGSPNKFGNQNPLEKTFLFIVLYDDSKITNLYDDSKITKVEKYLNFLWKKIIDNTDHWVKYLPTNIREKFKDAKGRTGTFYVSGKKVNLSKVYKCKYLQQIENDIQKYQHYFLLVDDCILDDCLLPNNGYKVYLDKKNLIEYRFCFNARVSYLTYSSKESFGEFTEFTEKHIKSEYTGASLISQAKNHLLFENNEHNDEFELDQKTVEHEQDLEKGQKNSSVEQNAAEPEASDRLNDETSDTKSVAVIKADIPDHQDSSAYNSVLNISDKRQNRRRFKSDGSSTMYHKDWVLDRQETGSGMMIPSVEFKYFSTSLKHGGPNEPVRKFIIETLRFACGCLNRRRNGTIYFGVADGGEPIEGIQYRDGQIIGFPIHDFDQCTMKKYTDELDNAAEKYIEHADAKKAARECIKSPEFIKVTSLNGFNLYVMEVDIEPSASFCSSIPFYLNIMKLQHETGRKIKRKNQPPCLFVRDGSKTLQVSENDEKYVLDSLKKYVKQREFEESCSMPHSPLPEKRAEKLFRKICMGQQALDKSLWPILVLTKPEDIKIKSQAWVDNFKFIKLGNWVCVFDFDDCSYEQGIFGKIFPEARATVTNEGKFKFVENVVQLRDELQSPEKVVWVYSNGRKEIGKLHKGRKEWNDEYSSGIKGAVQFFQQRCVIPEKRAIVILFLLSNDFAGVVETLYELVSHFNWKHIVIIADDTETYENFSHIIESERSYDRTELASSSIVGLSWEEVSSVFEEAMGIEDDSDCKIPTSSGAIMTVNPRFLERLKDIKILSATTCENRKFKKDEKMSFSHDIEKKFYQGNSVDWWNFYFETHVLTRHCFNSLKEKVSTALTSPRSDQQKIITVSIIHEPGAGGTTLARHILWEFRKSFKCAILERLTEHTYDEISELWKMFETDLKSAKPVLVLADDLSQADISFNDLYSKIHFMYLGKKLNSKTALPVCVLLKCVREEDFSMLHKHDKINEDVTVLLRQKLEEKGHINEKEWCERKYQEIEKTGEELGLGKYKPEHLIAFMILRSNFNMEFVKSTIESLLKNIDPESNQFKLLKYAALLFSYVESHNEAIDIHIPLECCDQLMADTNMLKPRSPEDRPWEYSLHEPVKILLRIEDKQRGSGRQIKMTHPNLARQVLQCIKNKTKDSTVNITLEYLKSNFLNNVSYAKRFIQEMTREMLIRRKKEEYDDMKNTKFSPLVEDMLNDSSHHEVAAVLVLGYEQLKDGMIAQQLARVYIHVKEFENAKTWADTARSIEPQRFGFIHTCGLVMREKFSHLLKQTSIDEKCITPKLSNQISLIEIAFQAIDIFNEATKLTMKQRASSDLLIYADTIDIILQLLSYVNENVEPFKELCVLHNYLVSPDFIPKELPPKWTPFHEKFKSLYDMGESAFRHVEDLIFCHTTIYERKQFHTKERKEHRSNRHVKFRLPEMQTKFSNFFGERGEDIKDIYMTDHDLRNRWYRGKLLGLKANSFIKIFDKIALIKKKKHTKEDAIKRLSEAKEYLKKISQLNDCDLANKISLNVALALLRAPNRESTQNVFLFCKELINLEGKFLHVAYLFIMIILWPNKEDMDGVEYDDKLFHKALRALGDLYNNKKEQMLASKAEVLRFKQEHNIFRATTQFFLVHGKGLQSVCHRSELFVKDTADLAWDELWVSPPTHLNLMQLDGFATSSSKGNFIIVQNNSSQQGDTIKIRNSYKQPVFVSEERVTFYLGFSFEGLVAYGVKSNSSSDIHSWKYSNCNSYEEASKEELQKKIRRIEEIKAKRDNNLQLHPDDQQLLQDEEDVRDAVSRFEEQFD